MIISKMWRKARKEHRCDNYQGCRTGIQPGQKYLRLYGAADRFDPPSVLKFCEACAKEREERLG